MDLRTIDILEKLQMGEKYFSYFEESTFTSTPTYSKNRNLLKIKMRLAKALPFQVWDIFLIKLKKYVKCEVQLELICNCTDTNIFQVFEYIKYYVAIHPQAKIYTSIMPLLEDTYIVYRFSNEEEQKEAFAYKEELIQFLQKCGFQLNINILKNNKKEDVLQIETIHIPQNDNEKEKVEFVPKKKAIVRKTNKEDLPFDQYQTITIQQIQNEMRQISFSGTIFDFESREIRSRKNPENLYQLQQFWIYDEEDAILIKRFASKKDNVEEEIRKNDYVVVYGNVVYDSYLKELVVEPVYMKKASCPQREDTAPVKRVELHVHTKLSEMDGVCDIEEYIDTANRWGMNAIAITDHMVVQAFPKAQAKVAAINQKRDVPFQMIYGVEMNMVDPYLQIVRNANHTKLEEGTYCVFDLETTGLSARFDHIIEFGGQIVKDRTCIKSLQLFIKPPCKLQSFTTELTGIQQQDLDNALPFEECVDQILDFISDHILVAHNADFDFNFLNENLQRIHRKPLQNPIIDTLDLSRSLHKDRKGYRLGQIARSYGIRYDEDVAHRADYDAEVLAQTFLNMLNELQHIPDLIALQNMQDSSCFNKVRKKHVTILVKNMAGLKELFELITLSHTTYLSYSNKASANIVAEPRIIRNEISKRKLHKNLLVGSSCLNGEIFDIAQTRGKATLQKAMKFYDYIEIQPLENYRHLIERNAIADEQRLKEILNFIIEVADELQIPVVATGDCHYVHPSQKKTRDIYINSQAIGGVRHPLYIYNQEKRRSLSTPNQHMYTTNEMLEAFAWTNRAQEFVIDNSQAIAQQISPVYPVKNRLYPPEMEGSDKKLRDICYKNAYEIYGNPLPAIVEQRLEKELASIIGHGFYVVYYISHLLVKKSNEDGYLVGSRGSVGSSFVATMSKITEVNPLCPHYVCHKCHYHKFYEDGSVLNGYDLEDIKCPNCGEIIRGDGHDIPFETFLGFEGDKVPDIDLNFSGEYQPYAHAYTKEVFGENHVFRAGTIGTVAEQTAFGYVKGYEEEMGIEGTVKKAQELRLAKACEGVKRTTGQHPGGIIVIPLELDVHDFTPVQYPANNPYAEWKTTHFDFHQIHDNVLKFDILGHVDPTAMKLLEQLSGVDVTKIPMNDPDTMSIFSTVDHLQIDTTKNTEITGAAGIPEFGTQFVRGILELCKPTTFDELLKISGLSHGTDVWLGNAKDLIDEGICTLKSVIGCRDDIMVYLLHKGLEPKLAFTIMESVRKGKGVKAEWIPAMKEKGVEDWYIGSCQKIKYMFPKAHAVAYVMMAVRIAWFKVHKPIYYYAMFFSIRCDAYDIIVMIQGEQAIRKKMSDILNRMNDSQLKKEVTKKDKDVYNTLELALEMVLRGYRFSNIDILRSDATKFLPDPNNLNCLIPPFTSLDGLGESVAESIVEARKQGAFLSKKDLQNKTLLSGTILKKLEQMHVLDGMQDENQLSLF